MELTMTRADWTQLAEFVQAANAARDVIRGAATNGREQVSLRNQEIDTFKETEAPAAFWMKLGGLLHEQLKDE